MSPVEEISYWDVNRTAVFMGLVCWSTTVKETSWNTTTNALGRTLRLNNKKNLYPPIKWHHNTILTVLHKSLGTSEAINKQQYFRHNKKDDLLINSQVPETVFLTGVSIRSWSIIWPHSMMFMVTSRAPSASDLAVSNLEARRGLGRPLPREQLTRLLRASSRRYGCE